MPLNGKARQLHGPAAPRGHNYSWTRQRSTYVSRAVGSRVSAGLLSVSQTEPDNLRTLTAVIYTSAQRA
jgi:hypothetical protein